MQHYLKDGQIFGFQNSGFTYLAKPAAPDTPAGGEAVGELAMVWKTVTPDEQHQQRVKEGYQPQTIEQARLFLTPAPSKLQIIESALQQARARRAPIMSMLDGMQASATFKADQNRAAAIETAKQALKDLTKIDLSTCTTDADCKSKILLQYRAIATALPADIRVAFAEALK